MSWTNVLRCPRCQADGLTVHPISTDDDPLPARGEAVCKRCGARYSIKDHILDLAQRGDFACLTVAGLSNVLPLMPQVYEDIWRPRSLTRLTGSRFPLAREIAQVNDWLQAKPGELIVDLGSSTDLYARGIARSLPQGNDAPIVAIDMATGMLRAGRAYARREGITMIAHLRAPAQRLPFGGGKVDALVCGGSLNEFQSIDAALREARRVCAPNGRMVALSLLAASSALGQTGQWGARLAGIKFPTLDQFNSSIVATGWTREKQKVLGVVAFTLMRPVK